MTPSRRVLIAVAGLALAVAVSAPVRSDTTRYLANARKLLSTTGNVKSQSCSGNCYEGHDCTTCVGVRIWRDGAVHSTAVYDKTMCCNRPPGCGTDVRHGLCGFHDCPANGCPTITGPYQAQVADLIAYCVPAGQQFYVPTYTASIGNLSNNNWTCGSDCNSSDFYQIYAGWARTDDALVGGWASCPNPAHPNVECVRDDWELCGPNPTPTPTPGPTPPPNQCGSNNNQCFGSFNACDAACCGTCERRINCGSETAHKCFE